MTVMTMVQAINQALDVEMARNPKVILLGEDVGKDGGVFRVTDGLWKKYGDDRVIDTPLAESAILGTSIGLAVNGYRPVPEIQFDGFTYPALDQIISHLAKIRTRSRGRFTAPVVLRFPCGGLVKSLEHHGESPEAYFCHTPGLKVVMPSRPYDAKGLMISALRGEDPVIFMEPKRLYRSVKEEVPEQPYEVPIGKAARITEGKDVTIISWGSMVQMCLQAMDQLPPNISVELLDLRTLSPIDIDTILVSVSKTGRAVVVQEAPGNCSLSSEISALIAERSLLNLKAPVVRVTGADIPIPLPKMEQYHYPSPEKIVAAVQEVTGF